MRAVQVFGTDQGSNPGHADATPMSGHIARRPRLPVIRRTTVVDGLADLVGKRVRS